MKSELFAPDQQTGNSVQVINLCLAHHAFIVFVRTLQFMKTRLKGIDIGEAIHIPQNEIASRFFPYPKFECKKELQKLVDDGQLRISASKTTFGHTMFLYEALQMGPVNFYLIKPKAGIYDKETLQMISYLKQVSTTLPATELPPYFNSFLAYRHDCMNLFFIVDVFSGRIHTPVTSLKGLLRIHLLLDGQPTIGIDVATMQPLLLGKILKQVIGVNEYSNWLDSGEDIYIMLQKKAGLENRDQAKKRFFEILFADANNDLVAQFGNADWITWINQYKVKPEPRNPHYTVKPHSNLAWLLQSTEVKLMRKVWHELISAGIPFLSVHDEVIIKKTDQCCAERIFSSVLNQEFTFFKLNVK